MSSVIVVSRYGSKRQVNQEVKQIVAVLWISILLLGYGRLAPDLNPTHYFSTGLVNPISETPGESFSGSTFFSHNNLSPLIVAQNQEEGQTITFNPLPIATYGDPPITLSATASSGLPVTFESDNLAVATISGNTLTIVGAGTANIIASQSGDETYDPAPDVVQLLTVNKANLSAVADNQSKIYGDPNPAFTITYTGFKGTDNAMVIDTPPTVATEATQFSPVDSYPISFMTGGVDNNYTITLTDGMLTILKATLTATADNKTKIYGDPNPALTITYTGLKGTDNASVIDIPPVISTEVTQYSSVDSYAISFISNGEDDNYTIISQLDGILTITKASLSATADDKTRAYREADPEFTITYSGFKGSDDATDIDVQPLLETNATLLSPVNTYTIYFASEGSDNNYAITGLNDGTLTIIKADQEIDFANIVGKTKYDPPFTPVATATSGLPVSFASSNPAIISFSGTTATINGSGTVTLTASQAGDNNYNPAEDVLQEVFINDKKYQTITFESISTKAYGDVPFELTATASSALPITYTSSNTLVATITGSTVTIVGVGTTTITASQSGNEMYEPAPDVDQDLTVTKGNQTITFSALESRVQGSPPFDLTATASSGLPVSYSSVTPGTATVTGSQVTLLNAGVATIRATQPGNDLYNAAEPVSQSFCVNPSKPTITVSNNNSPSATLTSSSLVGNQWYKDGVLIPGATNSTFIASQPGAYTVKVVVETCESVASDPAAIIIVGDIQSTGVAIELRPNPIEDRLEVDFSGFQSGPIEVSLVDPLGRIVERHSVRNGREIFDLGHLASGTYWLVITQSSYKVTRQLIKK